MACWKTNWNPKETIIKTCATFLPISYSKFFFFVSVNLLLAVHSYNCKDESVPEATVLFYDPSIKFLYSEHIPYVILAVFVLIVFVLLPPLFLLVYPTRCFRACLRSMGGIFCTWLSTFFKDVLRMEYAQTTGTLTTDLSLLSMYFSESCLLLCSSA